MFHVRAVVICPWALVHCSVGGLPDFAAILGCWFLTHLNYFWRVTWGLLAFRSPGFGGLGSGVWIWVSGFRGVWGLVLHRRLRWFARGLLARRRTTPKGDSPGGGYSPGGGHSTTDVQSKAVDQGIFWVFRVFRVCLVLHPGHRSGLPFFYTRGTGGSKPVTVASRQGLHIRGWIRSSVRSSAQRQRRLLPRKGVTSGGLARERGDPKMDSRSLAVVRSRYLTIRGRAWGMRRMIHLRCLAPAEGGG